MSQTENKPKLSDIARQTNTEKAARFSSTMIPAPPLPKQQTPAVEVKNHELGKVVNEAPSVDKEVDEIPLPATSEKVVPAVEPTPVKPTRTRRSGPLSVDDVINPEPPKGEPYPRQVRISETHHKLLRKLAFTREKTMNHVLYNLLELLEQADQRDQQKGE